MIKRHGQYTRYIYIIYILFVIYNPSFCNAHSVWLKPTNPSFFGFRFSTLCSSAHSKHQNWHRLHAWKKTNVTSGIVSCPGGGTQIWPHIQHDLSGKRWLVQIDSFWQNVLLWKDVQEFNHPKKLRPLVTHDMLDHVGSSSSPFLPPKEVNTHQFHCFFFSWIPVSQHFAQVCKQQVRDTFFASALSGTWTKITFLSRLWEIVIWAILRLARGWIYFLTGFKLFQINESPWSHQTTPTPGQHLSSRPSNLPAQINESKMNSSWFQLSTFQVFLMTWSNHLEMQSVSHVPAMGWFWICSHFPEKTVFARSLDCRNYSSLWSHTKNPKFFNPTEVFCEGYWWENITLLLPRLFQHWNINHFYKPHASAKPGGWNTHPFTDPPMNLFREERKLSSERQVRCFLREVGMMLDDLSRLKSLLRGTPTWKTSRCALHGFCLEDDRHYIDLYSYNRSMRKNHEGISEVSRVKLRKHMVKHRWTMFFFCSHGFISWHEVKVVGWIKYLHVCQPKIEVNTLWWSDLPQLEADAFLLVSHCFSLRMIQDPLEFSHELKSEHIDGISWYLDLWENVFQTILERKVESKTCQVPNWRHILQVSAVVHPAWCCNRALHFLKHRLKTWLTAGCCPLI